MRLQNMMRPMILTAVVILVAEAAMADMFGTGANQFSIDFVSISSATKPSSGYPRPRAKQRLLNRRVIDQGDDYSNRSQPP
jgi:hypothetical protein